jgi:fructan beta-fructosidase
LIGWMSNWQYAGKEPTDTFRTAQSLPRVLGLRRTAAGLRLTQQPLAELARLRARPLFTGKPALRENDESVLFAGETLEISGEFVLGAQSGVLLNLLSTEPGKATVIGYDAGKQVVFIDRTRSGLVDFEARFAARHAAPLALVDGKLKLHVFVDRSSLEVFANDGAAALTDRIFPIARKQHVALQGYGARAECVSLKAWRLRAIWQ